LAAWPVLVVALVAGAGPKKVPPQTPAIQTVSPANPALAAPPSVAVFQLAANTGVDRGTADVLTDLLVEELRTPGVFGRVVSARELEELISFEKQRELAGCTQQSCMAELAGALGVDFIVIGGTAKIGKSAILSIKLIDVKLAVTKGSLARQMCAQSDETLLKALRPAVRELLIQSSLLSPSMALPIPAEECGEPPAAMGSALNGGAASGKPTSLPWFWGGAVGAGLGVATGALGVVLALAASAWMLGIYVSPEWAHILKPAITQPDTRIGLMWGTAVGIAVTGLLVVFSSLVLLGGGGVALIRGAMLGP
jgi:hypothetical protein